MGYPYRICKPTKREGGNLLGPLPDLSFYLHPAETFVRRELVDEALDADQGADSFEILKFKDFFKIIVRVIKSLFKLSVAASQLI